MVQQPSENKLAVRPVISARCQAPQDPLIFCLSSERAFCTGRLRLWYTMPELSLGVQLRRCSSLVQFKLYLACSRRKA